jgi:hypothetical protein
MPHEGHSWLREKSVLCRVPICFLVPATGFHEAPETVRSTVSLSILAQLHFLTERERHYPPNTTQQQHRRKGNLDRFSSTTVGTMSWFQNARAVGLSVVLSQLLLLFWVMAATRVHATPFHHHHHPKGLISVQTARTLFRRCHRSPTRTIATTKTLSSSWPSFLVLRGGGSVDTLNGDATTKTPTKEYQEVDSTTQQPPQQDSDSPTPQEIEALQSYRMQQQILLQLRATYLGEALARRGLPMTTVADVSTPEGASPPQPVDWDCALSTETNPMSCLFSFDAEPGTKVVAPLGTTHWIGLATLNRLRRQDPTKVEPMWHSKYAILNSWFDDPESDYSFLPHVGFQGFVLNALLQGIRLPIVVGLSITILMIIFLPVLEYFVNRLLVSSFLWSQWTKWYRFVHAALPLKLFLGQMMYGYLSKALSALTKHVKDVLVEMECTLLEQCLPLTVGVPDMIPPTGSTSRRRVPMDGAVEGVELAGVGSTEEEDDDDDDDEEDQDHDD